MLENMGLKKQILTSLRISTSAINLMKQVRIYLVRLNPVLFPYHRTSSLIDNAHPFVFSFHICMVFHKPNKLKEDGVNS